jgi:hypothetical protein
VWPLYQPQCARLAWHRCRANNVESLSATARPGFMDTRGRSSARLRKPDASSRGSVAQFPKRLTVELHQSYIVPRPEKRRSRFSHFRYLSRALNDRRGLTSTFHMHEKSAYCHSGIFVTYFCASSSISACDRPSRRCSR